MPAEFETGFFVREPAWHGLGVVLDDYPGREEAMRLAGHDFKVVERPVIVAADPADEFGPSFGMANGWKALIKEVPLEARLEDPTHGRILNIARDTYTVVQNDVGWDIVDAIVGEGAKYETGITLKGGSVCSVLAWLDEPVQIPGDDAQILPYLNVSWAHDGSGSVTGRPTSIRTVCWNTQSAAEALGKHLGYDFTLRHSRNVHQRIEEAKLALRGVRDSHAEYLALARELAEIPVTTDQRELFVVNFLPLPPEALISSRVRNNVEEARGKLRGLFDGPTIPEAHELTAYGLHLAGVEYLDHLRGYRSRDTLYGRALLRDEPAKAKLTKLVKEVARS